MMRLARGCFLLVASAGFMLSTAGGARAASTDWMGNSHAAVRLITASNNLENAATLDAGLEFRFAKGWHGYWRTPGDAGVAPVIDWSASDNIERGEVAWPAPHRLVIEGLQNSVYESHVVLPVKLFLRTAATPARIHVSVAYAACSEICVPYQAELSLPVPLGPAGKSTEATTIDAARKGVPGSVEAAGIEIVGTRIVETSSGKKLLVDLRSDGVPFERPDLFVEGTGDGIPAAPEVTLQDGARAAHMSVALPAVLPPERHLTLTLTDGERAAELPLPTGAIAAAPLAELFVIALSALFGGLLLNLMPCVLPVLSIKLFAFVRHADGNLRDVRFGSAATACGIVGSFMLLAVSLIALKSSGAALGWGIQFQQPWFLAGMAVLTVLFAASFFEWFPLSLPASMMTFVSGRARGPILEAFLTGVFATLLATPCSAPFVGTAVGFALARGPSEILAIFLFLGIGMALPFLFAALFPGCVRWLPRPGSWMLTLRRCLSVVLLGTAVWLVFVLWSTAGVRIAVTTATLLAGLFGYRALINLSAASPIGDRVSRWSKIVTAGLVIAPIAVSLSVASPVLRSATAQGWQAFDPDAVPSLVADGKTVLVDVTATWCLTCKINEFTVLENAEVRSRLGQPNIVRMRADWSRPDPSISNYLNRFARYGIPLNVVYGPALAQGEALPELLTTGAVLHALDKASARASAER
ncbi:protein-disulfide reductase DsbD family protein [Bradyrhizobium genosp. P]|uniref:protein-disulfide reductase DsbD family protein n=1 Tax=Bradyrhizobium genosp. P TaxID=83641 RepID=UPI003CF3625D